MSISLRTSVKIGIHYNFDNEGACWKPIYIFFSQPVADPLLSCREMVGREMDEWECIA